MKVMLVGGKGRHNDRFIAQLAKLGVEVIRRWDANSKRERLAPTTEAILVMHDHISHVQYKATKKMAADADVKLVHVSKKMALTKRVLEELGMGFKKTEKSVSLKKDRRGGAFRKRNWTMPEFLAMFGLRNSGWSWSRIGKALNASETAARVAYKNSPVKEAVDSGSFAVAGVFSSMESLILLGENNARPYIEAADAASNTVGGLPKKAVDKAESSVNASAMASGPSDLKEQTSFWEDLAGELEEQNHALEAKVERLMDEIDTHKKALLASVDSVVYKQDLRKSYLMGFKSALRFFQKGLVDETLEMLEMLAGDSDGQG